jgi:hypothetical protein
VIAQDLRGDMFVAFPDKFEGLASWSVPQAPLVEASTNQWLLYSLI